MISEKVLKTLKYFGKIVENMYLPRTSTRLVSMFFKASRKSGMNPTKMITTSLAQILAARPCEDGWKALLELKSGIGENEQFPLSDILKSPGRPLEDILWAIQKKVNSDPERARFLSFWFATDCAERVLPIYEKAYPSDLRVRKCIETSRAHLLRQSTDAACDTARAAARAAARDAAAPARDAAWTAERAAWSDVGAAAGAANAAWADADTADVADAAWAIAWDTAREWQNRRLKALLDGEVTEFLVYITTTQSNRENE